MTLNIHVTSAFFRPIYNLFIAPFASNICAVCFFLIVHQICMLKSNFANTIAHSSMWGGVDKMTYPLYLTHYMFLKEPFEIVFSQNSFVQLFAFVVLSLTTAFVLKGVSKIFLERFS